MSYKELLAQIFHECAEKNIDRTFDNCSEFYASIFVEELLNRAYRNGEEVVISGCKNRSFYSRMIEKVERLSLNVRMVSSKVSFVIAGTGYWAEVDDARRKAYCNFNETYGIQGILLSYEK